MASTCTSEQVISGSSEYESIPKALQGQVAIYLLASIAGGSMDPATLVSESACMSCIPREMREPVMIYLLCKISDQSGA